MYYYRFQCDYILVALSMYCDVLHCYKLRLHEIQTFSADVPVCQSVARLHVPLMCKNG